MVSEGVEGSRLLLPLVVSLLLLLLVLVLLTRFCLWRRKQGRRESQAVKGSKSGEAFRTPAMFKEKSFWESVPMKVNQTVWIGPNSSLSGPSVHQALTALTQEEITARTGGDVWLDNTVLPAFWDVFLLIKFLFSALAARVIYEVPHCDSDLADVDKRSTGSSAGSSQWVSLSSSGPQHSS